MRKFLVLTLVALAALSCVFHAESARLGSNEAIYQAILAADRGTSFVSAEPAADVFDDVAKANAEAKVATITVTCPADATLTLDDYQIKQTGPKRLLHTPPLERAGTYHLRAFVCTASGCFTETKKVHVNPGEEIIVSILSQYASASSCVCGPNCPCTAGQCGTPGCPTLSYGQPIFFGGGCAGGACGGFGGGFMMGGGGCAGDCCGGRCR